MTDRGKIKIDAKEVLRDLRSGMSNLEIQQKYQISDRGLQSLFQKLVSSKLISESELRTRISSSDTKPSSSSGFSKQASNVDQPEQTQTHLVRWGKLLKQVSQKVGFPGASRLALPSAIILLVIIACSVTFWVLADRRERQHALVTAASAGDVEQVGRLLRRGAVPEKADREGLLPLVAASKSGHAEIVNRLIQAGADVNAEDEAGDNALITASRAGQASVVRLLLARGARVNAKDRNGVSALMAAAYGGNEEAVQVLLAHGADFRAKDMLGETALIKAFNQNHPATVNLLMASWAALQTKPTDGYWARWGSDFFRWACQSGHSEVVAVLLAQGANPQSKDKSDLSPIVMAAQNGHLKVIELLLTSVPPDMKTEAAHAALLLAAAGGRVGVVNLLLSSVAIDMKTEAAQQALLLAAAGGHREVVSKLLDSGALVESMDKSSGTYGATPLMMAAKEGRNEVVKLLLEKGANLKTRSPDGWTALWLAVYNGHMDTAGIVLSEKGWDVNERDPHGITMLQIACKEGDLKAVQALVQRGAKVTTAELLIAYEKSQFEIVKFLLDQPSDDSKSDVVFREVINRCDSTVAQLLIAKRNIQQATKDDALISVCEKCSVGPATVLLDHGASVDVTSQYGWTPLLIVAKRGDVELAELLLSRGAEVNARTKDELTPLMLAATQGHPGMVQLLLDKGADPNAKTDRGWTAMSYAKNNAGIAELLKQHGAKE